MPKWYTQVDGWRRLLQIHLQAAESQRAPMDTFEALKDAESCACIIAQTLAPKHIRQSGEVRQAFMFAGNRALFRELNYLQKAILFLRYAVGMLSLCIAAPRPLLVC